MEKNSFVAGPFLAAGVLLSLCSFLTHRQGREEKSRERVKNASRTSFPRESDPCPHSKGGGAMRPSSREGLRCMCGTRRKEHRQFLHKDEKRKPEATDAPPERLLRYGPLREARRYVGALLAPSRRQHGHAKREREREGGGDGEQRRGVKSFEAWRTSAQKGGREASSITHDPVSICTDGHTLVRRRRLAQGREEQIFCGFLSSLGVLRAIEETKGERERESVQQKRSTKRCNPKKKAAF